MEKFGSFLLYTLVAVIIIVYVWTNFIVTSNEVANPQNVKQYHPSSAQVIDHLNGVYYFPYTREVFGDYLSGFRRLHPELDLVCMTVDNDGIGYFVCFKNKPKEQN